jgi:hypothetical protein
MSQGTAGIRYPLAVTAGYQHVMFQFARRRKATHVTRPLQQLVHPNSKHIPDDPRDVKCH